MNISHRLYLTLLIFFVPCLLAAQKVSKVTGTYTFYVPETMSLQQAQDEALRRAQIEAIANEFGTTVSQANMLLSNEKNEKFYEEGFSLVKGEWIETIGDPVFEKGFHDLGMFVKCTVKGRAREITALKSELDIKILNNGTDYSFEGTSFKNGNKIYMKFKSPVNGYVSVYLHDKENDIVSCLLPYKRDEGTAIPVSHDKEYTFFSKVLDTTSDYVDEYRMGCEKDIESNTLYVIFSKNAFTKANTNEENNRKSLRFLSFDKFNNWLSKSQVRDKDMQIIKKIITIEK